MMPNQKTREVPLSSVTRAKRGWYTFNYAVYFPATKTCAWINHREYGFPCQSSLANESISFCLATATRRESSSAALLLVL